MADPVVSKEQNKSALRKPVDCKAHPLWRALAAFIDYPLFLGLTVMVMPYLASSSWSMLRILSWRELGVFGGILFGMHFCWIFFKGGTPAKLFFKLDLVDDRGRPVSYEFMPALLRSLILTPSYFLGLGPLWLFLAARSNDGRHWIDRLAGTWVCDFTESERNFKIKGLVASGLALSLAIFSIYYNVKNLAFNSNQRIALVKGGVQLQEFEDALSDTGKMQKRLVTPISSMLYKAINSNDLKAVQNLVDRHHAIRAYDFQNFKINSPTKWAIEAKSPEILRFLIERGFPLPDNSWSLALRSGDPEAVRIALRQQPQVSECPFCLHHAIRLKDWEVFNYLLHQFASKNPQVVLSFPDLFRVMGEFKTWEKKDIDFFQKAAKALIQYGGNLNQLDSDGKLPFGSAISSANLEAFQFLLANGGDVNLKDRSGVSYLNHVASRLGQSHDARLREIYLLLVKAGANENEVHPGYPDLKTAKMLWEARWRSPSEYK